MEERAGVEEAVGEDKDVGEWGAGRMSGTTTTQGCKTLKYV